MRVLDIPGTSRERFWTDGCLHHLDGFGLQERSAPLAVDCEREPDQIGRR